MKSLHRNNTVLRRLRYALKISEKALVGVFAKADFEIRPFLLRAYLHKEDHEGFVECPDEVIEAFLDGLIVDRRGKREPKPGEKPPPKEKLTNNVILRKIRIALELKESDMLEMMKMVKRPVSRSELSALFRKTTQRNFRPCGNQFLRYFLTGLTKRLRGDDKEGD